MSKLGVRRWMTMGDVLPNSLMVRLTASISVLALVSISMTGYLTFCKARALMEQPCAQATSGPLGSRIGPGRIGAATADAATAYEKRDAVTFANAVEIPRKAVSGNYGDRILVAQSDSGQQRASVAELRSATILICGFLVPFVIFFALMIARSVTAPIKTVADLISELSEGSLDIEVPGLSRRDEIGNLGVGLQNVAEDLRAQIGRISEGVQVLGNSASEIFASVSRVMATTAQTSMAVTESSATMDELKQTARVSNRQAQDVAASAQEAVKVSETGQTAIENSLVRMNLIQEQMKSVDDSVGELNRHSQTIEAITSTMQDLADQSNLLAVNASIEAARAGEQGKGFTVVANEIKSLADHSKKSTKDVRLILQDMEKSIKEVVKASQDVSLSIQAGAEDSLTVSESIKTLTRSVEAAARAANIIRDSSEQQFEGVDQASHAMSQLQQAITRSGQDTTQLENAAKRMVDLGGQLREIVDYYRIGSSDILRSSSLAASGAENVAIRICGAGLLTSLTQGFVNGYTTKIPEFRGLVIPATTARGFAAFIAGEADMAMATRVMTRDETEQTQSRGIEASFKLLGQICVAVVINASSTVQELTMEQLRQIFVGEITNWNRVGGPDCAIQVTTRPAPETGSGVAFQEIVLKGAPYAANHLVMESFATTVTVCEGNPGAIGYIPTSTAYFRDMRSKGVRALAIKAHEGSQALTPRDGVVKTTQYPITVPYYLFWNEQSPKLKHLQGLEHQGI
jgi:methyl-accepting chemotaxis protein/ABC-type phosphate transport system substrate-binding protein